MAIPTRDSLLIPYTTNVNTKLIASGTTTYDLPPALVAQFTAVYAPWLAAYNAMMVAREAGDRSEVLTAVKNQTRTNMMDVLKLIYATVQNNRAIDDSDKIALGVHLRARPSPIPPPAVAPGMDVVSVTGRTVLLHIHDTAAGSRNRKPAGAKAAYVYSFVGTEYPADPAAWSFEGSTTRSKFEVALPTTLPGGTQVWFRAAWVNAKQQQGPLCTPVSTNLQGGGAVGEGAMKIAA